MGTSVRIIPRIDRSALICTNDLPPFGESQLPSDAEGVALNVEVPDSEALRISYFGHQDLKEVSLGKQSWI